jgi:hypothetical protein
MADWNTRFEYNNKHGHFDGTRFTGNCQAFGIHLVHSLGLRLPHPKSSVGMHTDHFLGFPHPIIIEIQFPFHIM